MVHLWLLAAVHRTRQVPSGQLVIREHCSSLLFIPQATNGAGAVKHRACVDYSRSRSSQMDVACSFYPLKELCCGSRFHYCATRPGKYTLPSAPAMALTRGPLPAVCVRAVFVLFLKSTAQAGCISVFNPAFGPPSPEHSGISCVSAESEQANKNK